MRSWLTGLIAVAASLLLYAGDASAQMSSQPFSFGGGSSLGMSNAGRQAILNQKLTGATPDNILRGADGSLIEISQGPGSTAIARGADGVVIPGYHGRGGVVSGGAGLFNPYFTGNASQYNASQTFASGITSNSIAGWTSMVFGGAAVSGGSSIDAWMSMICG
jgi:hypothetical protein